MSLVSLALIVRDAASDDTPPKETAPTVKACGCASDSECKGDRICEGGACKAPVSNAVSACMFEKDIPPQNLVLNLSTTDADRAVAEIGQQAGLSNLPRIFAGPVANAAAMIQGRERLIVFNSKFMDTLAQASSSQKWTIYFVLAHELGHHVEGHTIATGCDHRAELQADAFAARMLKRLGASEPEATAAMRTMSTGPSQCHPSSETRLAGIVDAYRKETGGTVKRAESPPPPKPDTAPPIVKAPPVTTSTPAKWPAGTVTLMCGCWGVVMLGNTRQNPACASGVDQARGCQGWCMGGGVQWGAACM